MKYVIDSSSIINLFNAGALHLVCRLERCQFWLPPLVVGECGLTCAAILLELKEDGLLGFVDDDVVDADLFVNLLADHGLGGGETECIALAITDEYGVCCDDRKAREIAGTAVGADRVIGTLKLLRWCVEDALVRCDQALELFREMRRQGGFLPDTAQGYFCSGA